MSCSHATAEFLSRSHQTNELSDPEFLRDICNHLNFIHFVNSLRQVVCLRIHNMKAPSKSSLEVIKIFK